MTSEFICPHCKRKLTLERIGAEFMVSCEADCPGSEGATDKTELAAYLGLCYLLDELNHSDEDEREQAEARYGDYKLEMDRTK